AAWSASRSACRMETPERARSMTTRAARPTSFCLAVEPLYGTPGGTFWFQIFIQASSPEIWSETISGGEERAFITLLVAATTHGDTGRESGLRHPLCPEAASCRGEASS